jgi:ABC-type antimicrobial peptide transport system permease subunit
MGVRRALGARNRNVINLVVLQGARLIAIGGLIGGVAALGLSRLLGRMLYGIDPFDPWTYLAVFAVLGGVGLFACYIPASRAARVDPLHALRYE